MKVVTRRIFLRFSAATAATLGGGVAWFLLSRDRSIWKKTALRHEGQVAKPFWLWSRKMDNWEYFLINKSRPTESQTGNIREFYRGMEGVLKGYISSLNGLQVYDKQNLEISRNGKTWHGSQSVAELKVIFIFLPKDSYKPGDPSRQFINFEAEAVHEIGHIVFWRVISPAERNQIRSIFDSLKRQNFDFRLLQDAAYVNNILVKLGAASCDRLSSGGHPWDNPSEFFASVFTNTLLFRELFERVINNTDNPLDPSAVQSIHKAIQIILTRL